MSPRSGAEERERETCVLHGFDLAERVCHDCGHWYCDTCLVTPWGPRKPALCMSCALARSGVRRRSGTAPVRSAREIRQIEKAERRGDNVPAPAPVVIPTMGASRPVPLPAEDDGASERRGLLRRRRSR